MTDQAIFNRHIQKNFESRNDKLISVIHEYMAKKGIRDYYTAFDDIGGIVGLGYSIQPCREKGRRKDTYQVIFDFKPNHLIVGEREGERVLQTFETHSQAVNYMAKEVFYRFMRVENLASVLNSRETYRNTIENK